MQLFQVVTRSGGLVMTAPLETVAWVLRLRRPIVHRLVAATADLDSHFELPNVPIFNRTMTLLIKRLPLEVPHDSVVGPAQSPEPEVPPDSGPMNSDLESGCESCG